MQRKIAVIPHLRQVERIEFIGPGLLLGHQLHLHQPARIVAAFDGFEQVALVRFAVLGDDGLSLRVGQVPDPLLSAEVELDPRASVVFVVEAVRVASESVHVAEGGRNAARRHRDGHLMQRLGQQRPEVPVAVRAAQSGARVALDGVVQVGKLQRIAQEEDRGVVAHEVPVAGVGVELDGEAADVAFGIRRAAFSGHGREAHEARGLLAHLGEDRRPGVFRDVVHHGEGSEGSRSFGVHAPFGDDFAVEVGEFFEEPRGLQGYGAAFPGCLNVLVVGDGPAVFGCQFLFVHMAFVFGCDGFPACKCMI